MGAIRAVLFAVTAGGALTAALARAGIFRDVPLDKPIRIVKGRLRRRPKVVAQRTARITPVRPAAEGAPQGGLTVLPTEYPLTKRDESVVEELHGIQVADPYRWLEDPDSEETKAFVEAQNALTQTVLAQCDSRDKFKELMTRLYDYERYGCPYKRGDLWFFSHNSGLQAQNVLYVQRELDGDSAVLLDPNKLSSDGTVALMGNTFSKDGSLMAYALSSGGSDWRKVKFLELDLLTSSYSEMPDTLNHVKFSSMAWSHDHKGLFYNKYPKRSEGKGRGELGTETDINLKQQLVYHVMTRHQDDDVVLLEAPEDHPEWMLGAEVTDDGRYLLISVSSGTQPSNRVWYIDLQQVPLDSMDALDFSGFALPGSRLGKPLPLVKLVDNFDASYSYVANEGTVFTFLTNLNAPLYRLVKVDLASAGSPESWEDLIPQHETDLLQWASAHEEGNTLVVCYLHNVVSQLELRDASTGQLRRDILRASRLDAVTPASTSQSIPMPGLGSVAGFSGRREDTQLFFMFTGFTEPGAIYQIDLKQAEPEATLFRRIELKGLNADDFETAQHFVSSRDGTRVPMFIVQKKGTERDGNNPTLLYGYGGFNISLEPSFSVSRLCFMLAYGGIYAVANLRGGGEFGIDWRNQGSKGYKQNVFNDFQACAEHLISAGYTNPSKLTIQGGSNGGLLVAACANQRPDMYAAVIAQVGVMDMLRFHKFTIGHAWTTDYGDPDDVEAFEWIYPYSPLHNVRRPLGGTKQYPAMLLTTGDHDDRVVPLHSHKLTATLQHVLVEDAESPQRNPIITRVEVRAGHGAGKPTEKIIAEAADCYAFAAAAMRAQWVGPSVGDNGGEAPTVTHI